MRHIRYFAIFCLITLFSCKNENIKNDTEKYNYTASDDLKTLRWKLKSLAKLDSVMYGEIEVYDEYYMDIVTELFIKSDNKSSRYLTIISYKDKMRLIKIILDRGNNMSNDEFKIRNIKYQEVLKKLIDSGNYKPIEENYFEYLDGNHKYACAMIVAYIENYNNITCYLYSAPIDELEYLKFMVSEVINIDTLGLKINFVKVK